MTEAITDHKLKFSASELEGEGASTTSVSSDAPVRSSTPDRLPRRVPFLIPQSEAYYWTREWQDDEAEALKEIERGEGRVFYDPKEAAQWLRSPED